MSDNPSPPGPNFPRYRPVQDEKQLSLLTEAPLSDDWNKENVPIPSTSQATKLLSPGTPSISKTQSKSESSSPIFRKPSTHHHTPLSRQFGQQPKSQSKSGISSLRRVVESPESPSFALASVFNSPANLLKRSMSLEARGSLPNKRRRELFNRPAKTLKDVQETNNSQALGASPNLDIANSLSNPSTPQRKQLNTSQSTSALDKSGHRSKDDYSVAAAGQTTPTSSQSARCSATSSPNFKLPSLKRSFSENNAALIMKSLSFKECGMTGDFQRWLSLPVMKKGVKHPDLNTIDCHTLAKLIGNEYKDQVNSFRIIDARYVYEYEGGHIKNAENFGSWDPQIFFDTFLPANLPLLEAHRSDVNETDKRDILIFHCEFSSVRGPGLMRELRKRDRSVNKDVYPALHYPECYLLHNGYKEFFQQYPQLCYPQSYQTMSDPQFSQEEKQFRKKSKSWAGIGTVSRTGTSSRILKL